MKIDKDTEARESQRVARERLNQFKDRTKATTSSGKSVEDSVQLPLGRAVQETLDSISSDPARSARIAEIKQLLQKGGAAEYFKQVSTDDVATSVSEELSLEILSSRDKASNEE